MSFTVNDLKKAALKRSEAVEIGRKCPHCVAMYLAFDPMVRRVEPPIYDEWGEVIVDPADFWHCRRCGGFWDE